MSILTFITILGWIQDSHQQAEYYLPKCSIRYETRHYYYNQLSADEIHQHQPLCNKTFKVAYADFPPYVFQDEKGNVKGLIPIFFQKIFNETCCLGQGMKFEYLPEKTHKQLVMDQHNYSIAADLAIPIPNFRDVDYYTGMYYSTILYNDHVDVAGVLEPREPADKMTSLFKSLIQTWPLLLMTVAMAIGSGSIVWILDNKTNNEQFPEHFPDGMAEGIWWAFVSMTTVGYGDRTPSFWAARLFAVVWIFIGVTFFGMYLGTITSVMTTNLQIDKEFQIQNKKIGVLSWTNAPKQVVIVMEGFVEEYNTPTEMIEALKQDQIDGIALDSFMMDYYMSQIKEAKPDVEIQTRGKTFKTGIGFVTNSEKIRNLITGFYGLNMDNIIQVWSGDIWKKAIEESIMSNKTGGGIWNEKFTRVNKNNKETLELFTYKHPSFLICLVSMFVTSCVCVLINQTVTRCKRKRQDVSMESQGVILKSIAK
ncbi:uncharacterized protein [Clytia hemisphaerica]|uniref:Potassium channel domain-containing protein n=1 Tax=Clytia hemisphaerica TaxID=252671 RepID=A0A7M5WVV5_9CNID